MNTDPIKGFWPMHGLDPLFNWGPGSTLSGCKYVVSLLWIGAREAEGAGLLIR